jgi:hypothetical protein
MFGKRDETERVRTTNKAYTQAIGTTWAIALAPLELPRFTETRTA